MNLQVFPQNFKGCSSSPLSRLEIDVRSWRPESHRQSGSGPIERRDSLGAWHRSAENPRTEASRTRTTIYDQFFALPSDGFAPTDLLSLVGCGVAGGAVYLGVLFGFCLRDYERQQLARILSRRRVNRTET